METRAVAKYVRISPRKARLVMDQIRGKRVEEALNMLTFAPQKAARIVKNVTLSSYVLSLNKAKYFFFLQPTLAVSKKGLTDNERRHLADKKEKHQKEKAYFLRCYAHMNSSLKKLKIDNFRFFNLSDIFDDTDENEDIFIDSYHFGDKGNELAAMNIFRHIEHVVKQ